jgi:pyruvate, orthophosphate dikinase
VLVREETSPDDLEGMVASLQGLLTSRGGLVSHAAVVARGFGIPAVCGAAADRRSISTHAPSPIGDQSSFVPAMSCPSTVRRARSSSDRSISWSRTRTHGSSGCSRWADAPVAPCAIYANADTPEDARRALAAGAHRASGCAAPSISSSGTGSRSCSSVILSSTPEEEAVALAPLEAQQRADFEELLEVMDGRTVVVRLLDPPLHEFLPTSRSCGSRRRSARSTADGRAPARVAAAALREHDPMLGHPRGLRLGVHAAAPLRGAGTGTAPGGCGAPRGGVAATRGSR